MTNKTNKIMGIILSMMIPIATFAQEAESAGQKEMKTGWTLSALPCATYSTDMGFQYGAFGDVYYYGDGNTYPDPLHKISWEVSHFTKGRKRTCVSFQP